MLSEIQAKDSDFKLSFIAKNDSSQIISRSDQWPFIQLEIPALLFKDGMETNYHKPIDTPETIDMTMLSRRAKFIFALSWEIALELK